MFKHLSKGVKKFWASIALLSLEMITVLILFLVSLVTFVYVIRKIFVQNRTSFDNQAFEFVRQMVSERNNDIMQFFTFLGTHNFLIPANLVLIAYYLFIKKHRWYSIKIPAIAITSLGLMFGLKHLFNRPRPDMPLLFEAGGLSFPSGHALMSVTFYGLLVYIVYTSIEKKGIKWLLIGLLILLIIFIGFTRVYLRVHYASDVIAGYCVGFLWLSFAIWILNRMENFSRKKLHKTVNEPAVPKPATEEA